VYDKSYVQKNKEKLSNGQRRWRDENKERCLQNSRNSRWRKPELYASYPQKKKDAHCTQDVKLP